MYIEAPWPYVAPFAVRYPDDVARRATFCGMLSYVDETVANVTAALKRRGMWANTLLVYTSDNGGVAENGLAGINFPFRGEKHGNWRGGMNTATFVSGGFVPAELRGTENAARVHVVDWYPTFCRLAGRSACDRLCRSDCPRPPRLWNVVWVSCRLHAYINECWNSN